MNPAFAKPPPSRAATPAFRMFRQKIDPGVTIRCPDRGQHRGEWMFLGTLIPWMLGVACLGFLWRLGGPWLATFLILPATWLMLQAVAFLLGTHRAAPSFWLWSVPITAWAAWATQAVNPGPLAVLSAWVWWTFLAWQALGIFVLSWRKWMTVCGWRGVWLRITLFGVAHLLALGLWATSGAWIGLPALLLCGAFWCWFTFCPRASGFGPLLFLSGTGEALITIDDGPDPETTPAALDLLDQYGQRAVFFLIGEKVREHPQLAREILLRGHEVGNHTMTHPQARMWCLGPWRTRWEIRECQKLIEEVTGFRPRWFRAPVGHRNAFTHPFAAEAGLEVVAWTRRCFDTTRTDLEKMAASLCDKPGSDDVLLLHDATPVASALLEEVLRRAKSENQHGSDFTLLAKTARSGFDGRA